MSGKDSEIILLVEKIYSIRSRDFFLTEIALGLGIDLQEFKKKLCGFLKSKYVFCHTKKKKKQRWILISQRRGTTQLTWINGENERQRSLEASKCIYSFIVILTMKRNLLLRSYMSTEKMPIFQIGYQLHAWSLHRSKEGLKAN